MAERLVLVNGLPGSGKTTLARALGPVLGATVISKDVIKEAVADAVALHPRDARGLGPAAVEAAWWLAARIRGTVVVDSWFFRPRDAAFVQAGLARVGAAAAVEVWCDAPPQVARERYRSRVRHAVHDDATRLEQVWDDWAARAEPLALHPVVTVDTSGPVDVDRLAEDVRTAADRSAETAGSTAVTTTGADDARIAQGYAVAFPDGDAPLRVLARLTEELGEVASAVAHLERHGTKVAKHGEPDVAHLADEVEDLVHNAFALLRQYGAEGAFDDAVRRTLARLRDDGRLA